MSVAFITGSAGLIGSEAARWFICRGFEVVGHRLSGCSVIEAIDLCQEIAGRELQCAYTEERRRGDHLWWISSTRRFRDDYPAWTCGHTLRQTLEEIHDACR